MEPKKKHRKTPIYNLRAINAHRERLREAGYVSFQKYVKPEDKVSLDLHLKILKEFNSLKPDDKAQFTFQKAFIDGFAEIAATYIQNMR